MKIVLALAILILIAVSFVADYKWRRWLAVRRQERDQEANNTFGPRA